MIYFPIKPRFYQLKTSTIVKSQLIRNIISVSKRNLNMIGLWNVTVIIAFQDVF